MGKTRVAVAKVEAASEPHEEHSPPQSLGEQLVTVGLFVLTAVLYLNTLKAKLVFDDYVAVQNNKVRTCPAQRRKFMWAHAGH